MKKHSNRQSSGQSKMSHFPYLHSAGANPSVGTPPTDTLSPDLSSTTSGDPIFDDKTKNYTIKAFCRDGLLNVVLAGFGSKYHYWLPYDELDTLKDRCRQPEWVLIRYCRSFELPKVA